MAASTRENDLDISRVSQRPYRPSTQLIVLAGSVLLVLTAVWTATPAPCTSNCSSARAEVLLVIPGLCVLLAAVCLYAAGVIHARPPVGLRLSAKEVVLVFASGKTRSWPWMSKKLRFSIDDGSVDRSIPDWCKFTLHAPWLPETVLTSEAAHALIELAKHQGVRVTSTQRTTNAGRVLTFDFHG